jgi:four helix bundle protein
MNPKIEALKKRTFEFALKIIELCRKYPKAPEGQTIARQLARAGTAIGSNYRSVCRARSDAEFVARLGIVLDESDESDYWLSVTQRTRLVDDPLVGALLAEAQEFVAIFASSLITARRRLH